MNNRRFKSISLVFIAAGGIHLFSTALAQENSRAALINRPTVQYNSGGLRDPFQSPMAKKEILPLGEKQEVIGKKIELVKPGSDVGELKIQGTIWGGKVPQAIINDEVLGVGDKIEGVEILNIDKDGITLSSSGIPNNFGVSANNTISAEPVVSVKPPILKDTP